MFDYAYCLSTKNRNQLLLIGYLLACGAVDGTRDQERDKGQVMPTGYKEGRQTHARKHTQPSPAARVNSPRRYFMTSCRPS